MSAIAIAQLIAQLLPYGVKFTQSIIDLLHRPDPSAADWKAALDLAQTPFDQGLNPGVLLPSRQP